MVMIGDEGQSDEGQAMESLGTGTRRETEGELLAAVAAPLSEVSSTNWPCSVCSFTKSPKMFSFHFSP